MAAACGIGLEILYRKATWTWWELLPIILIPNTLISYALFRLIKGSESIFGALIIFSLCGLVLRIVAVLLILREQVGKGTWIALGLVFLANLAKSLL